MATATCAATSCAQAGAASPEMARPASAAPVRAQCDSTLPSVRHELSPRELHDQLPGKELTLINVHIPYAGEIEGTDANIAYTDSAGIERELAGDHAAKVVLYCRSGAMSRKASMDLVALGYCNVYDLTGGMDAWQASGFTLVTK